MEYVHAHVCVSHTRGCKFFLSVFWMTPHPPLYMIIAVHSLVYTFSHTPFSACVSVYKPHCWGSPHRLLVREVNCFSSCCAVAGDWSPRPDVLRAFSISRWHPMPIMKASEGFIWDLSSCLLKFLRSFFPFQFQPRPLALDHCSLTSSDCLCLFTQHLWRWNGPSCLSVAHQSTCYVVDKWCSVLSVSEPLQTLWPFVGVSCGPQTHRLIHSAPGPQTTNY